MRWVQGRLDDPPVQITISLLTPFVAYLLAERLELSGVLAVVAAGMYLGWHSTALSARTRLQAQAFWEMAAFFLNGFIFIMIGLQLPGILRNSSQNRFAPDGLRAPHQRHRGPGAIAWVFPATYLPRWLSRKMRARDPVPPWQHSVLIAWAGMRGVVSLAAAFALPIVLADRQPFPGRSYILFLTFCVILTTLVFQGLTLPILIRKLGVEDDGVIDDEERRGALAGERSRSRFHRKKAREEHFPEEVMVRVRAEYCDRIEQLTACCAEQREPRGRCRDPDLPTPSAWRPSDRAPNNHRAPKFTSNQRRGAAPHPARLRSGRSAADGGVNFLLAKLSPIGANQ